MLPVCYLALACQFAPAQEEPEAPKPKVNHKLFIAGMLRRADSNTADASTTRRVLDLPGGRGSELSPIFGSHLSPAQQAGINLGIFTAQSTAFYFTERSRHKWIRWTGRVFLAEMRVANTRRDYQRLWAKGRADEPDSAGGR